MITLVEKITNKLLLIIILIIISACAADEKSDIKYEYPKTEEEKRAADNGKLTGEGIVLFGKRRSLFADGSINSGGIIGINTALWRATLDTLSFMPLLTVDPFGGVVITDWYENNPGSGERFKINAMVLSSNLRSDAIKINVFKQLKSSNDTWKDVALDEVLSNQLEESILDKARKYNFNAVEEE